MNHVEVINVLVDASRSKQKWMDIIKKIEKKVFRAGDVNLMKLHGLVKSEINGLESEDVATIITPKNQVESLDAATGATYIEYFIDGENELLVHVDTTVCIFKQSEL